MPVLVGLVIGLCAAPLLLPRIIGRADPVAKAIMTQVRPGPLARFYRSRNYRPLWITHGRIDPAAWSLLTTVRGARADDLDPAAYHPAELAADLSRPPRDPSSQAAADLALSRAFANYVADLHRPPPDAAMAFVDPAVPTAPIDPSTILERAAAAPSLSSALKAALRMNPIYERLRAIFDRPGLPGSEAALVRINLERARALPPDLGRRYLLVNIPGQTLEAFDNGHKALAMRVVVGASDNKTPAMIGAIRYALFNPYWQVPPDLVREDIAPAVIRDPRYLALKHYEAVAPAGVDWEAVEQDEATVEVRQTPGPDNVMGKVKFMLPNPLGIYLHDTPDKYLFAETRRTDSHGCVRLQNALRLADWLFARRIRPDRSGPPDQRTDLSPPVPVYIVYLTLMPSGGRLKVSPDIYQRDAVLSADLAAGRRV